MRRTTESVLPRQTETVHPQVLADGRRTPLLLPEGLQDPVIHRTSTSLEALLQVPLPAPRRPRGDPPRFDATAIFDAIQAFKLLKVMLKLMRLKVAKTNKNITSMTRLTRQNRMKERLTSTSDGIWQRKQSLCNTNFSTRLRTHIAPCA